ncbi:MAG: 2-hydroxychromene-2-carboxylate isomerase [Alphaproteobacteria bacterium]
MSAPELHFWYDFASTYSYPAAMRVEDAAAPAGVSVVWRPFLLGPIFAAQGWNDSPFNVYPVKGRYMWRDLTRICADEGLPFNRPGAFPQNSLLAARIALIGTDGSWVAPFSRAVFEQNFVHGKSICDTEILRAVLNGLGLDPAPVIEKATSPENKERLKAQVNEAQWLGIFGAPSFVADGELFWGFDRMRRAVRWAAGERM